MLFTGGWIFGRGNNNLWLSLLGGFFLVGEGWGRDFRHTPQYRKPWHFRSPKTIPHPPVGGDSMLTVSFDASNYYNESDSEFDLSWFCQKKLNVAFEVTVSIEVNIWLNLWLRVEKCNYCLTNTCNRLKHDFGWKSYAIFKFFFSLVNINQYKSLNQFNLVKISAIMNNTGIIRII